MKKFMTEQLPITIKSNIELIEKFVQIKSVTNKLEAQFNFQTMTAGWYGDEDNILFINLFLETPEDFLFQQRQTQVGEKNEFADDVISYFDQKQKQIDCFISLTDAEQQLLVKQKKLLSPFIQTKLQKVLNLIALQQKLLPI